MGGSDTQSVLPMSTHLLLGGPAGGVGDLWPSSQGALKTSYWDVFNALSPGPGRLWPQQCWPSVSLLLFSLLPPVCS